MATHSRRYLVTRTIFRAVFWLGVFVGACWLTVEISPYL